MFKINIKGVEFERIKYYTPMGNMEKDLLDNKAFINLLKNRGVYVAETDENTKLFAMKFNFGDDEIPFMAAIDNVTFSDGYMIVGIDKECMEYFMPVF